MAVATPRHTSGEFIIEIDYSDLDICSGHDIIEATKRESSKLVANAKELVRVLTLSNSRWKDGQKYAEARVGK